MGIIPGIKPGLVRLILDKNPLGDAIAALVSNLPQDLWSHNISQDYSTRLSLNSCLITDQGANAIATCLSESGKNLVRLDLRDNDIGECDTIIFRLTLSKLDCIVDNEWYENQRKCIVF